ncbi:ParB/RepB/Spo0J family partition protein [Novosphingobium album (ex Liu et al. 2023)]|uniref:ParB N-terminal domain-containing protein n=1 Tax=Novosphingobium album (ex Liu et al. 2023) TaxID=3031130 RepID=A0ABT5WY12_9SPHN|nr:ParB/RepB/Spo0J family partition protein [Novosphingobium album (ex Liu et al. 2023)]MDE8654805.1 ParB N-terminal domain-containing protein [Novosphingobium album (ex Liu et al. 2023)]
MTVRSVLVQALTLSPFNVRQNEEDANATGALEASIAVHGLLLPLIVHPMPDDASYGVLAGGRRLRAIQRLVADGRLPADWPVDVIVRELLPAEITELSLAENLLRRELRPYEIHAAIARAHEQGASVGEIAANIGQRERWVVQQLRLGTLVPEILEAYASGTLALDDATAYAATEDHDLQRAAWSRFAKAAKWDRQPHHIRAFLKVGDREAERLLRFIGEDVYRAAGGRFELDLFADEAETRGRVVDEGLLRQQVENKLAHLKQQLRQQTGRSDLRFAAEPPQAHGYADHALEFVPKTTTKRGVTRIELPDGEVVATLEIRPSGEAEPRWWWASRKARRAAEKGGADRAPLPPDHPARVSEASGFDALANHTAAQAARAAVKDEHGLTADGLQVLRSLRRELLRAILVADALGEGTLGRDYAVWSQLRQALGRDRHTHVGARGLASPWDISGDSEPTDVVAPFVGEAKAGELWKATVESVCAENYMTVEDPADAFTHFHFTSDQKKRLAGAVLAGLALVRSANVPGWRVGPHDRLARLAGATDETLRELWEPTPAFLALVPKMKRLELAQPHVEAEAFRSWHKLVDPVLTGAAAGVLKDAGWIHPLLSFGVAPEQHETREAAE